MAAAQHPDGAAIDWGQVAAAGYTFAAIKVTEGDYYVNPYFAADVAGAQAAGLRVISSHFAVPNVSGGGAQAQYALRHEARAADGQALPLELDVEYDPYTGADHTNECYGLTPAQMVAWIGVFGAETQRRTGHPPVIYTTAGWWAACTGGSTAFRADPLWVAASGPSSPALPPAWRMWAYWQFTSRATVPGIRTAGRADVSRADIG